MNPEDAVLFPSRGDEVCIYCRRNIVGEYTHLTEPDGWDVIVCPPCFVEALLAAVTQ